MAAPHPSTPHPSMLFVVDGDEIRIIRGDISPTLPSTPVDHVRELEPEVRSEHAAPSSRPPTPPPKPQEMLAHALAQVPGAGPVSAVSPRPALSAPAPTRVPTRPPPPPSIPPPPPSRSMPKSPPQSLYLKRREVPRDSLFSNSSFDIEAMIERSSSPVGNPYDVGRTADEAFEHFHNEFMDLITISGAHARAQARVQEIGADIHRGCQAEHGTTGDGPFPSAPQPMPSIPESPLSGLSAISTPHVTQPLNIRYYDHDDGHATDGSSNSYSYPTRSSPKISPGHHHDGARNQSPSPPLLRTPETPPAPVLPTPPHRLFTKVPSASNIHERRRRNPHRKKRTQENFENAGTRTHEWTSHQGQQAHGIQPQGPQGLSVFIANGNPAPAIIVPPLNLPVPPIALGPLPPVPSPIPTVGRRSSPGTPSTGGTSTGINGPRSARPLLTSDTTWSWESTPSPSSAAANSAALSHLIFPSSASSSSGRLSASSHMSRGSRGSRRPASMQPQPSPREFTHSKHLMGGTLTPGRPISAISYHFGGISIPASSPVVQAFEDIGALPLTETNFNPAAPFTQPRPAPQPQPAYRLDTPPNDRAGVVDRPQDLPLSPVTPTHRERAPSIPPKALALLGIYSPPPEAPKKTSPFSKMTDLVRKRQAQGQQPSEEHEANEVGRRKGILGRHRASVVVDDRQQGLWRVQTADSTNVFWNDPESFAPLTGHAQRAADSTKSRNGTPKSQPLQLPQPHSQSISGPFAFALEHQRHAHKGSFSSTHSFPLSVGNESIYPSSVLSKKSSFEAPRLQTSPKVYANPKNLNSFKSSVDGGLSPPHSSPLGHKPKSSLDGIPNLTPGHKPKSSLDGIPNLTPNSRVGVHSPPPSDHKIYKQQGKSYHTPSLSPIVYSPPGGGTSTNAGADPSSSLQRPQSPPSPRTSPRRNNPIRGSPDSLVPGPPRTSSLAQTMPTAGSSPVRSPHSAPVRPAHPPRAHTHTHSQGSAHHKMSTSMSSVGSMGSMGSMGSLGSGSGSERFEGFERVERLERFERFPFPPTHIPVNLHLRPQPIPHPQHPRARKGSASGMAAFSADESFFEPDTPSPRGPAHFKGLRSAVKGHMWENRI